MNKRDVVKLVAEALQGHQPSGAIVSIVEDGVRQDGDWWYVPVDGSQHFPNTYQYYELLADVEGDLEDAVNVLLVPAA